MTVNMRFHFALKFFAGFLQGTFAISNICQENALERLMENHTSGFYMIVVLRVVSRFEKASKFRCVTHALHRAL